MREVPAYGIEAQCWTVVFHRQAENHFFSLIAMGHFKHVSALAWIPELSQWWVYDVGFRRTRLKVLIDGPAAQTIIAAIVEGNATVTVDVRDDNLPWMRLGLFCTTAVSHLIGLRCGALRPDALFRRLAAAGGIVRDDFAVVRSPKLLARWRVRCARFLLFEDVSVAFHGDKNGNLSEPPIPVDPEGVV